MSESSEERLGLASFEVRREAAVERSLAKIRHHLGKDWTTLSAPEITTLGWLLGELWATKGFMSWETVGLDKITLATVDHLVDLGNSIRSGATGTASGLKEADSILGRL